MIARIECRRAGRRHRHGPGTARKNRRFPGRSGRERQSGWRDLNPRPLAPKASALPSCATPRWRRRVYAVRPPARVTGARCGGPRAARPRVGTGQRARRRVGAGRQLGECGWVRGRGKAPPRRSGVDLAVSAVRGYALRDVHRDSVRCRRAPRWWGARGRSSMAELQSSKLTVRVRFPSPAPTASGPGQRLHPPILGRSATPRSELAGHSWAISCSGRPCAGSAGRSWRSAVQGNGALLR